MAETRDLYKELVDLPRAGSSIQLARQFRGDGAGGSP
jgi:hypothetical protein